MIHEHHLRIYKTLVTFDQKVADECRKARNGRYQLKFEVSGAYPERAITSVESLEPKDDDFLS
jgi:hypothetical protein